MKVLIDRDCSALRQNLESYFEGLRSHCGSEVDWEIIPIHKGQNYLSKSELAPRISQIKDHIKDRCKDATVICSMGVPTNRVLFGRDTELGAIRGVWKKFNGVPCLPTFSADCQNLWHTAWEITQNDIKNALWVHKLGGVLPEPGMEYLDSVEKAVSFLNSIKDSATPIVFDLETTALSPYRKTNRGDFDHRIITLAFALSPDMTYFLPLDHKENPLKGNKAIKNALRALFSSSTPFIAHNAKFDMQWVKRCLDVWVKNLHFDTVAAAYLINENHYGSNSLKALTKDYTVWGGYETGLGKKVKSYEEYDLKTLFKYNCFDVAATYAIYSQFKEIIREEGLNPLLFGQYVPAIQSFARIEATGQHCDRQYLVSALEEYEKRLKKIEIEINRDPRIQEAALLSERIKCATYDFNILDWLDFFSEIDIDESTQETKNRLDEIKKLLKDAKEKGDEDTKAELLEERKQQKRMLKILETIPDKLLTFADLPPKLNFRSTKHLQTLLYEVLKLTPPAKKKLKSGALPTDKQTLDYLAPESDIVQSIIDFRKLTKPKSDIESYITKYSDTVDTRVHAEYNLTFVRTGRTSSSNPNAQNLTSEAKLKNEGLPGIKRCIISRFEKGKILQADYSQLELKILALYSKDPMLTKTFVDRQDLHAATAALVFDIPISEVTKVERQIAKAINFGIVYEIGAPRLAEELQCTLEQAEAYQQAYFQKFPNVLKYRKDAHREASKNGFVLSQSGRRRRFPELFKYKNSFVPSELRNPSVFMKQVVPALGISEYLCLQGADDLQLSNARMLRQAGNAKIQGLGSDCTMRSITQIENTLRKLNLKSVIINSVHDSIVLDVHPDEIQKVASLVRGIMEYEVPKQFGSFVTVPLTIDLEIGDDYGNLDPLENIPSHPFVYGQDKGQIA